ncbi:hypothetical protein AN478_04525 [Thiohalorhabdus denitrificans]|uniref:Uncharacterized protein n=1 Tax=Thiohalorhabdus denitrificans TaxID=381306 RepID=A0A0P9EFJ0_9GAMM|nr:hypothetical protein [Thiohalorhabdus denitrificans]KPV41166.1 hypothetical protein AN478_04525 [Thiohalorhabdus denitrificans]SCY35980.1 hypothetical protein SAMN05661077_1871 [Thiohalorhabdus denitrificans]
MNQQRVPLTISPDSMIGEEKYRVSGAPLRGRDWWFSIDTEGNASILLAEAPGEEEEHLVIDLSPNEDATRSQLLEADLLTLAYWLRAAAVEYLTGYSLEEIPRSEWESITEGTPVQ